MKQFLLILLSYLTVVSTSSINGFAMNKSASTNLKSKNLSTATSSTPSLYRKTKEQVLKINKLEFNDLQTFESGEKINNDSGIDYIPVSLQHPLFKVFGIDPNEYVVYYKYNRESAKNFQSSIDSNEVDELNHKQVKMFFSDVPKRPYRHTFDMDDNEFSPEEIEQLPLKLRFTQQKKRSYNLQQSQMNPHDFQYLPHYPYPGSYLPPYNPYSFTPYPFHYPQSTCQCNIPTCKHLKVPQHPFQFHRYPNTYRRLTGLNTELMQYPEEDLDLLTKRK